MLIKLFAKLPKLILATKLPGSYLFNAVAKSVKVYIPFLCTMVQVIELEQLDEFSITFWEYINDSRIFAFHGEMGAGKTTFIAALCRAKGKRMAKNNPFTILTFTG
jgi:flagellar biosynthesis GTPase FlhF